MSKSVSAKRRRACHNECESKYRYNDPETATRSLRGWTRRIGGELKTCPFSIYHCLWCSGWHVGRYIKKGRAAARYVTDPPTKGQLALFTIESGRIIAPNPKRIQLRNTGNGKCVKITNVIRERITTGELAPGASVPSEAALCEEFTVFRNTVRRALGALENEGLIETLPGAGRIVRSGTPAQYAYQRIFTDIRGRIEKRRLTPGDILPSEAAIGAEYGVSRGTVRAALAVLANAGLTEARHGKGHYVR